MFYRVAIRPNVTECWQWRSTPLSSQGALFAFLRQYQAIQRDRLQVFSAATREELNEQLAQANRSLGATRPVTASLSLQGATGSLTIKNTAEPAAQQRQASQNRGNAMLFGGSISAMEKKRFELEYGEGGNHDEPYVCTLPVSTPQMLAWIQLRARVQRGELEA